MTEIEARKVFNEMVEKFGINVVMEFVKVWQGEESVSVIEANRKNFEAVSPNSPRPWMITDEGIKFMDGSGQVISF